MQTEIATKYEPADIEQAVYESWLSANAFGASPDDNPRHYVIMMPLPNVTGALHMGHAMDNVMQDLLIRWHRMQGDNTLWMPGTDHAGIATQAVVEKRLIELEGKTRHDIGRDELVRRIWEWKEKCQDRIIRQQQSMGCSCDWQRARFTLDAVCARAVRWTFFRMFSDRLIYRGTRLVNWDCHLQTAVADDEIEHLTVDGHFWHLRYPVIDPQPGEPDHVVVATTRPETMLGDTAVACHPDPAAELARQLTAARQRLASAPSRDKTRLEEEVERLEKRQETHLPQLLRLVEMARAGRQVMLPLQNRKLPIILDEWAKPELGSGCVKITPGHDPNDYEVWTRHRDAIASINILNTDGSLNQNAGDYAGLDRLDARRKVVADLDSSGLLAEVEDRRIEVGHSDRSKTPIEPYLSLQWFVRMSDVDGGIVCGRGTSNEFRAAGLAQIAIEAARPDWSSASGRNVSFHPDQERYAGMYQAWLAEKRDWCISRQLWWGHRIPVWTGKPTSDSLTAAREALDTCATRDDVHALVEDPEGGLSDYAPGMEIAEGSTLLVCLRDEETQQAVAGGLEEAGLRQDPDVLDTWFSSAVWPHSTLGWPDPASARQNEGQPTLAADGERPDTLSYYYPGSCLITGRDIITLWVARMVVMGLYNLGDLPFTDVFLHANILDGNGERMSKSKGNGIDPVDIIERYGADAMRYVLCEMQTGTQDIRLPVQAFSPFTGNLVDLAKAKHGRSIFTYLCPETGKEFDVLGTMEDLPGAKLTSERFEVGRNFANKLWNATRFALLNLDEAGFEPRALSDLEPEDRWILSRLTAACTTVGEHLEAYNPAAAIGAAREFFWSELCDWYLELLKPRVRDAERAPMARQVLAVVLDQVLRLLHPFIPFLTEELWAKLGERAPNRGIETPLPTSDLLTTAAWVSLESAWRDEALEARFDVLQNLVRAIRDLRSKYNVPPASRLAAHIRAASDSSANLSDLSALIVNAAGLESLEISPDAQRTPDCATAVVNEAEVFVAGVVDPEQERKRLGKQRDKLSGQVEGCRRKLGNENFVSKARPDVVERERGRLQELEAQLANLDTSIAALE